ncbi:UNVERIFIED_CONTAM: hypothetical protein GTU68_032279 [Idotea baltica]|nr:hypothetical protein [Idotea baltica]
MSVSIKVV